MERRSHRIAVLVLVVLLHLPALFAIRAWMAPRFARPAAAPALRVEFVLNAEPPIALPMPQRRSREGGNPVTSFRPPTPPHEEPKPLDPRVRVDNEPLRLYADDGSLRIPSTLAQDIAPKQVEAPNSFHIPRGDDWILREPRAPIEYAETRFAQSFLPADMNPVEEACWRHKGLAFVLTMLGSRDCAAPGQKDPVPTPQMIVYGVDDADTILRKTEDWRRYNE